MQQKNAAQNAHRHHQRNGDKSRRGQFFQPQTGQTGGLGRNFGHIQLILQRTDDTQTQPGKGHTQTA